MRAKMRLWDFFAEPRGRVFLQQRQAHIASGDFTLRALKCTTGTTIYAYVSDNPITGVDPQGLAECGNDAHCQDLNRIDTDTCNAITKFRGSAAGRACHASASERLAACLRGRPLPPLNTWNNRTMLPDPAPVPVMPAQPLRPTVPWWAPILPLLIPFPGNPVYGGL
jgi:hypothetical protein